MEPIRCISSRLTSELLKFRNPQGAEENWIINGGKIHNYVNHFGKVITTEIALSILSVTAAVEAVAYATIGSQTFFLAICARPISKETAVKLLSISSKSGSLFSSSFSTFFWNIGNVFIFNPFFINVCTHESFFRYSMDYWSRGRVFNSAYVTSLFALSIIFRDSRKFFFYSSYLSGLAFHWLIFKAGTFTRWHDFNYLSNWSDHHQIRLRNGEAEVIQPPQIINTVEMIFGEEAINAGANFFNEFILQPGQVDDEDRQKILDGDADICTFILARAIYIYAFGDKRDEEIPSFFKKETISLIKKIRQKYAQEEGIDFEHMMRSSKDFGEEQKNLTHKEILNDLKKAAYEDMQRGILITSCWNRACKDALKEEVVA